MLHNNLFGWLWLCSCLKGRLFRFCSTVYRCVFGQDLAWQQSPISVLMSVRTVKRFGVSEWCYKSVNKWSPFTTHHKKSHDRQQTCWRAQWRTISHSARGSIMDCVQSENMTIKSNFQTSSSAFLFFIFWVSEWGYWGDLDDKNVSILLLLQLPFDLNIHLPRLCVLKSVEAEDQLHQHLLFPVCWNASLIVLFVFGE